jgi:UDP-glucose 4-epimerase
MNYGISGSFNLRSGTQITINNLIEMIKQFVNKSVVVKYDPKRPGDVRDSLADVSALKNQLNFTSSVTIEEGLCEYVTWAKTELL